MNNSINKDGASSTSGLSTNTSGSSILSNNSMNSANKSSLSSNGSYLNYDASNLASLKSIRKLQSGANEIFATFESMNKYVYMQLEFFVRNIKIWMNLLSKSKSHIIIYQLILVLSMMPVYLVQQINLDTILAKVSTCFSVRFKNTFLNSI